MCLLVSLSAHQFFFFAQSVSFLLVLPLQAALSAGQIYKLNFTDVDGRTLSTSDGHVTVLVLTTTAEPEKARSVGDRVPDYCLGNPNYRMITVLNFKREYTS